VKRNSVIDEGDTHARQTERERERERVIAIAPGSAVVINAGRWLVWFGLVLGFGLAK
jgi:hypothetical protein